MPRFYEELLAAHIMELEAELAIVKSGQRQRDLERLLQDARERLAAEREENANA